MREELTRSLFACWPRIFAAECRDSTCLPVDERVACGDGWFPLIAALCEALQWETDHAGAPQIVARQIKDKLGSLRFAACGPRTPQQEGAIQMAVLLSARIPDEPVPAVEQEPPGATHFRGASAGEQQVRSRHTADTIIRVARAGGGPLLIGEDLGTDAIVRIINSTSVPITVKAGRRTGDALVRIVKAGGSRISLDFS